MRIKALEILREYFPIWKYLARKSISNYSRGSYLGVVWTVLFPLIMMTVLLAIISSIFSRSKVDLFFSIAPGIFIWNFFIKTTSNLSTSIDAACTKGSALPNIVFPLGKILDDFPSYIVCMLIVTAGYIYFYMSMPWIFLFNFIVFTICFLPFVIGVGLVLCCLQVFFRDTTYIWGLVSQAGIFLTPVFLPQDFFLESKFWFILKFNPLFYFLKLAREPLLTGNLPSIETYIICFVLGILSILFGVIFFKKYNTLFISYT